MAQPPTADMTLQRSSRDPDTVRERLAEWLTDELSPDARPEVEVLAGVDSNGMSSETVVLDVHRFKHGERMTKKYVARVAPAPEDLPVFPAYRLGDQFRAMRLARDLTDVPVPKVSHLDETGRALGTPCFLMKRVDGVVPPDVLPYTFGDNWLFDASPADRARLQAASVEILAKLHAIPDATTTFAFLDPAAAGHPGPTLNARVLAKTRGWYDFAVESDTHHARSPLVERGLAWLAEHLPEESEPVLAWGDARIGNIMYRDFVPVAVLDWEMATLGAREMDLAWMVFGHQVFQAIAEMMGLPGMPDFMRAQDVVATYEQLTGVTVRDLTWWTVLAAVEWGCVFLRTHARQVHFGEAEHSEDPESAFYHRGLLETLLEQVGA